ncbi:hypothetical protein [Paraburkholderia sp. J12]|uniref:hypothetical protein n=1 Tax=Paraburkholderia sp. J12 TaxID=2805432 RepID=UPI002ABDB6F0|nr:hypothetical protein [Paraburkholderia sp. J12]
MAIALMPGARGESDRAGSSGNVYAMRRLRNGFACSGSAHGEERNGKHYQQTKDGDHSGSEWPDARWRHKVIIAQGICRRNRRTRKIRRQR